MIKYTKPNIYKIHLSLIRGVFEYGYLERILFPIGKAIKNCEDIIDGTLSSNNEDYIDSVTDYEVEIIENLLGTAFVACQTYITGMVSRIIALHKYHHILKGQNKLMTTGNTKSDILSFGDNLDNKKCTKVQLIDSLANYFKHRDEWSFNWDTTNEKSKQTIKIIKLAGAESANTGNLRKAAEFLGNKDYVNTEVFNIIMNDWCKNLYKAYHSELENLKLI